LAGFVVAVAALATFGLLSAPASIAQASGSKRATITFETSNGTFAIDSDGGHRRRVTGPKGVVSPNGKYLLRYNRGYRRQYVVVTRRDGSHRKVVFSARKFVRGKPHGRYQQINSPVWSKSDGRVYFIFNPDEHGFTEPNIGRIMSVRPDGTGRRTELIRTYYTHNRQTRRPEPMGEIDVSPDGKQILIGSYEFRDFGSPLDLVNLKTKKVKTLDGYGSEAKFSPNGSRILFVSTKDRINHYCDNDQVCFFDSKIFIVDADGSHRRRLVKPLTAGNESGPQWSPDGSRIVFSDNRNAPDYDYYAGRTQFAAEIYSIGTDGKCLTLLTNGYPASYSPRWGTAKNRDFAPARCGHTDRPPLLRIEPPEYATFWFGPTHANMVFTGRYDGMLHYRDCDSYWRSDCLVSYSASVKPGSVCRQFYEYMLDGVTDVNAVLRKGALVLTSFSYEGFYGFATVFTGNQAIRLQATQYSYETSGDVKVASLLGEVDALRPIGANSANAPLASPVLDSRFVAFTNRVAQLYDENGSLEKTAKKLDIDPTGVANFLRVTKDLDAIGPIPTVDCG